MANVLFSRTDSPSTKPITDGQIIFDTSGNGKMYLDNGTTRLEMGGAIDVDATLDATSTNPIQNKGVAGVMLSELEEIRGTTKKGFLTDALVTKTLDAKIGTTDISSIGDGTVTGAISDVNGNLSWKLLKSVTGTENVNISGIIYDELCIICKRANVAVQFLIPKSCLNSEVTQFENGGISSTKNIALLATSEYIALNYWYLGNTKYTSDVTTIIYYK